MHKMQLALSNIMQADIQFADGHDSTNENSGDCIDSFYGYYLVSTIANSTSASR